MRVLGDPWVLGTLWLWGWASGSKIQGFQGVFKAAFSTLQIRTSGRKSRVSGLG